MPLARWCVTNQTRQGRVARPSRQYQKWSGTGPHRKVRALKAVLECARNRRGAAGERERIVDCKHVCLHICSGLPCNLCEEGGGADFVRDAEGVWE